MEIEKPVDKKQLIIRMVAFIAVLAIAITAFSFAFTELGKKSEGMQTISAKTDGDALLYADGITLMYYCSGSSDDIKHQINEVQSAYSEPLLRMFKQTDNKKTYTGYVNLATLCSEPGNEFSVSADLFEILKDAYSKTLQKNGYNVFAGALNAEWEMLLYLDDPSEFDPEIDVPEGERIKKLAEMTRDLSNFNLEFGENTVTFSVSNEYTDLLNELEISAPILDLGLLRESYELEYVSNSLKKAGYNNGYIYTNNGLLVNLGSEEPVYYTFLGYKNGKTTDLGFVTSKTESVCSFFKAFASDGEQYVSYSVDIDGKTHLRHAYYRQSDGLFNDVLLSSMIYSETLSAIDVSYGNIVLNDFSNEDVLNAYVKSHTDDKTAIICSIDKTDDDNIIISDSVGCFTVFSE